MLSVNQNPTPIQQPTEAPAFKGNKSKKLIDTIKNLKCTPVGKTISAEEAKDMFVRAVEENHKKFKLEQLFKRNPAEAREVLLRESVTNLPKDFLNKVLQMIKK